MTKGVRNAKTAPAQVRPQQYLDNLQMALGALPRSGMGLSLRIDVAVEPRHWLHHHEIANYLRPVLRRLRNVDGERPEIADNPAQAERQAD